MKLEKMTPGLVLYDRHKQRMGNTTLRTICEWPVTIKEIAEDHVIASWNGNPARKWYRREIEKLSTWSMHDDGAVVERGMMGQVLHVTKARKSPPSAS